jgi:hypothetical protein
MVVAVGVAGASVIATAASGVHPARSITDIINISMISAIIFFIKISPYS